MLIKLKLVIKVSTELVIKVSTELVIKVSTELAHKCRSYRLNVILGQAIGLL